MNLYKVGFSAITHELIVNETVILEIFGEDIKDIASDAKYKISNLYKCSSKDIVIIYMEKGNKPTKWDSFEF